MSEKMRPVFVAYTDGASRKNPDKVTFRGGVLLCFLNKMKNDKKGDVKEKL